MGYQNNDGLIGRLFECFEDSVFCVAVHLVDGVYQTDAPACFGGFMSKEVRQFSGLGNRYFRTELFGFEIIGAPQEKEVSVTQALNSLRNRVIR